MKETIFTASGPTGQLNITGFQNQANNLDVTNGFNLVLSWAGGATSNAFTIPGLLSTSSVNPVIRSVTNAGVVITGYALTANTLTITFSANPGGVVIDVHVSIVPGQV